MEHTIVLTFDTVTKKTVSLAHRWCEGECDRGGDQSNR